MQRGVRVSLLAIAISAVGCGAARMPTPLQEDAVRYVALGDSYTIGTSVAEADRFPNQLAARIADLELVGNPAVNGYTSRDLIEEELPVLAAMRPELVTLLVGVNDVVQGVPERQYAANVTLILAELLTLLPAERIVCVATPDYTVTPQGAAYGDPEQQRAAIRRVNEVLGEACASRGIPFVPEIFEISREAVDDPSLVADDGLHPSGAQYARWVEVIAPVVEEALGTSPATLPDG
ncbi:MAG: SGNH/GDSL hydrolase family protein [Chloroflexi bacterium]|nr:SGNH/GDSL hydrolase family protein [Chloroflexota bacterium]